MAGTPLTRDEVIKAVGEVDDSVVAGLVGMGVTAEELAEARASSIAASRSPPDVRASLLS